MTDDEKRRKLEALERQWQEYRRRERKYRLLMEGAQRERERVEKEIKNL